MFLVPGLNIPVPTPLRSLDVYVCLFFILYLTINKDGAFGIKPIGTPIAMLFALTTQMLLLELIYGFGDMTGISLITRSIASILGAFGCGVFLWKNFKEESFNFFFKLIIICAITQGLVMWLSFFIPDFREVMSLIFHREDLIDAEHLILLRVPGFASSGGDGLSMNHGLLCVVAAFGVYYLYPSKPKRILLLCIIILANIGSAFTGRAGLYLGSLFICFLIFTYSSGALRMVRVVYLFLFIVAFGALLLTFSNHIGSYGIELREEFGYEYPIVRLLEGFIQMSESGKYQAGTTDHLLGDMVIFPEDPIRLLIGNNDFGQMPKNFIGSDIGYIRMLHGLGFFGTSCFVVGVFFFPVHLVFRIGLSLPGWSDPGFKGMTEISFILQMVLVILVYGIASHWKIFYLSSRMFIYIFFIVVSLFYFKMRHLQRVFRANDVLR